MGRMETFLISPGFKPTPMDKPLTKIYYRICLFVLLFLISSAVFSQQPYFTDAEAGKNALPGAKRVIVPRAFRAVVLNQTALQGFLWSLPDERAAFSNRGNLPVLELPLPDGTSARFRVWESSIREPGLQDQFPEVKTFSGQGIDDPAATIRFDWGPNGFHAQVLTINGTFYIDPISPDNREHYISYYKNDLDPAGAFHCSILGSNGSSAITENTNAACRGTELRVYRLAVACTGEYAQSPGINAGNDPVKLHQAIVTTVNRVVGILEKEVSVKLVLVSNNSSIEFLNAATDPFSGNNNEWVLINESQTVIDARIGFGNYDIGHTFSTGAGGLAWMGCVCSNIKAKGVTGRSNPTGDAYDIDYVAHEIGHQLGGDHTFNSMTGSCSGARNAATAYEVGSGTTIQAYAGICGSDNIQPHSDPYYHAISFDQISHFLSNGGAACGTIVNTGNQLPVIDPLPGNNLTIPVGTPFTLSATATDPDGDALTYCWEEWDLGSFGAWDNGATNTTAPLFKSRAPVASGSRTFPDLSVIYALYPITPPAAMNGLKGETLPRVARTMKFRLTVRDNRAGGGGVVSSGSGCQSAGLFIVKTAGTAPFIVVFPNGGGTYPAGTSLTINWNTAGTQAAPFNVASVRILLSADGGITYPYLLSASTPNDGTETLSLPEMPPTTKARIKIEAIGNIFFDVSNAYFSIVPRVLPVELTAFNGILQGNQALLKWSTATEQNSSHFELERSADGVRFQTIHIQAAAGESQSVRNYFYADQSMLPADNYYRLKLVDTDGSSSYSNIILLARRPEARQLHLNAVFSENSLRVRFSIEPLVNGKLTLFDITGRKVMAGDFTAGMQQVILPVENSKAASGIYFLHAVLEDQVLTAKIIKQ